MLSVGLTPQEPYPGSKKPWHCICTACGSSITPTFSNVRAGGGCKFCAGRVLEPAKAEQEMRKAGLDPQVPYPGVSKPWQCVCTVCGKIVTPILTNVRAGGGCKFCAGRVLEPAKAEEEMRAGGFIPLDPYPGAGKPWRCRCVKCGKEPSPTLSTVRAGKRCKFCMGRVIDPSEAERVMRAAGLEPEEPYPGLVTKPWPCVCVNCGNRVTPMYSNIRSGGGCRFCAGQVVIPAEAERVMREAGLIPQEPYPGSARPWRSICATSGHVVTPMYATVKNGRGCRVCGRERMRKKKTLSENDARLVMISRGLIPQVPYPGSGRPWKCLCESCGNTVTPMLGTVRKGHGCKFCAGMIVVADEAIQVMRSAGLEPKDPYPGAGKPWLCVCTKCQRRVNPRLSDVRVGRAGCKYCAGRTVDPVDADTKMRETGFIPQGPYPGSEKPWHCICVTCGREVTPVWSKVRKGTGCRYCAVSGFDYAAPAHVYILMHPLGAVKIGIAGSSARNRRYSDHARQGWVLFKREEFQSGADAWKVEQAVLRQLRGEGYMPFMSAGEMPQGGETETFDADLISAYSIWKMVLCQAGKVRHSGRISPNRTISGIE